MSDLVRTVSGLYGTLSTVSECPIRVREVVMGLLVELDLDSVSRQSLRSVLRLMDSLEQRLIFASDSCKTALAAYSEAESNDEPATR